MADDREKPKEACSKGLSEILEEDRISQLPDHLIYHILGYLSINDVVRPSILSTRWRGLWLWVPRLELSSREFSDFNAFASFGDKFFDSDRVSCIENLELTIVVNENTSYFTSWIDDAVKRNVQHLRLDFCLTSYFERPVSLYVCHTLVSLKLNCMTLDVVEFFSFPRLKTMHLTYLWLSKDATFERFVSSCPVLEDLEIFGYLDASQPLRVHSRSLKRLIIAGCASTKVDSVPGIIIDAPLLCDLAIIDEKSKSFIVNNMEYNAKLKIDVSFGIEVVDEASVSSRRSLIRSCLSGILKVEDLTIFGDILLKIIHYYSKSESLPQFGYMSQLSLVGEYMKWFEPFLESCPNLKSLVLMGPSYSLEKMDQVNINLYVPSSVPKCLESSLEFVILKFPVSINVAEMKLVRYFLENSAVLKRLTLHLDSNSTEDEVLKKLLEVPRASTKCKVVIVQK